MQKNGIKTIACQGCAGAFSHLAAHEIYPKADCVFFPTFEETLNAVETEIAQAAVVPVENSSAGRVADIHKLLQDLPLYVTGEHFVPVRHCLLGIEGADLTTVKRVYSHPQALSQCRNNLTKNQYTPITAENTAISAKTVAESNDKTIAAIASKAAAEIYGLKILADNFQDYSLNTTRFWVFEKQPRQQPTNAPITSLIFRVKNIPAVLYKCLGGFATNGINLLRIESFVDPDSFFASAAFLTDVAADQESKAFDFALQELAFFAQDVRILGTYPADPVRFTGK